MADSPPWGLQWRSSTLFITATVGVGLFTDLFLYGLIVPILPFMLVQRVNLPHDQIQSHTSGLLAAYAAASVIFSPVAGVIADRYSKSRQAPFLLGLIFLLVATLMLFLAKNVPTLVIARVLQGVSAAVVWTIGLTLVLDTVGPARLGTVIGTIFGFISIGELLAPVLGGIVYDRAGFGGVFGMAAGVLAVDFIMRIFLIEKKVAARYQSDQASGAQVHSEDVDEEQNSEADDSRNEPSEEEPLLKKNEQDQYRAPEHLSRIVKAFPILYCLSDPRLLVALLLALNQASLLATFDATIPTVAQDYYGFSSLEAGLCFIPLVLPYVLLGPVGGWLVDKKGTKFVAVAGFGYLAPMLILLRLIRPGGHHQIVIYCVLLAFNSIGLSLIGSPSVVEAASVVQLYHEANPELFGDNGPYAQLYGLNSMVFSGGLAIGPVVSGALKDSIGYGNMNLVVALFCLTTAILSFIYVGGRPKILRRK